MTISDMWKANATSVFLLVLLNLALFGISAESYTPWIVLGLLALLATMFFAFRQGMDFGHRASGISQTVEKAMDPESPTHGQLDAKIVRQAWSVGQGVKGVLACALVPYALGCLYIICALIPIEPLVLPTRLIAWVLNCPYWPVVLPWYDVFDRLTPAFAAVAMISPFVLPLCLFAGYMQGPRLWARSEKAMAEGRRRAKAKSRVTRKRVPKPPKPEV